MYMCHRNRIYSVSTHKHSPVLMTSPYEPVTQEILDTQWNHAAIRTILEHWASIFSMADPDQIVQQCLTARDLHFGILPQAATRTSPSSPIASAGPGARGGAGVGVDVDGDGGGGAGAGAGSYGRY
jgi:hypothetical protein